MASAEREPAQPAAAVDLQPPRGTRDLYPKDMALRSWLFGQWREVAAQHGFEEYDSPVLESAELYTRKVRGRRRHCHA